MTAENDVVPLESTTDTPTVKRLATFKKYFQSRQPKGVKRKRPKEPLALGVRRDTSGSLEARVRAGGSLHQRVFPAGTDIATASAWREHMRLTLGSGRRRQLPPYMRDLPKAENGYCYIYFVLQGNNVKIGKATDVKRRLDELQTASPIALKLLAAVGAHHSLEGELLKRFEPFRLTGEWFIYCPEIELFVRHLQEGWNPIEALFEWSKLVGPVEETS